MPVTNPPQHCEHYAVCYYVRDRKENGLANCVLCLNDDPYLLDKPGHLLPPCRNDTRARPAPAQNEELCPHPLGTYANVIWTLMRHGETNVAVEVVKMSKAHQPPRRRAFRSRCQNICNLLYITELSLFGEMSRY